MVEKKTKIKKLIIRQLYKKSIFKDYVEKKENVVST